MNRLTWTLALIAAFRFLPDRESLSMSIPRSMAPTSSEPIEAQTDMLILPILRFWPINGSWPVAAIHDSQEFLGSVMDNRFDGKRALEPNTVYYWRSNRISPECAALGHIRSFETGNGEAPEPTPRPV